eukprot:6978828-Prymnesium_polylepis.1
MKPSETAPITARRRRRRRLPRRRRKFLAVLSGFGDDSITVPGSQIPAHGTISTVSIVGTHPIPNRHDRTRHAAP